MSGACRFTDVRCVTILDELAITNMMINKRFNSSACEYRCEFKRVQDRTSAHCGLGKPLLSFSECKPYICDLQQVDTDEEQEGDEDDITIEDGVRCTCMCLNFKCNCANSTEPDCHELLTWICHVGTINDTGTHSVSTCGCMCDQPTYRAIPTSDRSAYLW